jgi:hypothetical protein
VTDLDKERIGQGKNWTGKVARKETVALLKDQGSLFLELDNYKP